MRTATRLAAAFVVAAVLAACDVVPDGGSEATATPTRTPAATPTPTTPTPDAIEDTRTPSPDDTPFVGPDPCEILTEGEVTLIGGEPYFAIGASGGSVLQICTFESEDGLRALDLAVVDLEQLARVSDDVTAEEYIEELAAGAGDANITELADTGEGRAIVITFPRGSQAWAWRERFVFGAYATDVTDPDRKAVELLEAALERIP